MLLLTEAVEVVEPQVDAAEHEDDGDDYGDDDGRHDAAGDGFCNTSSHIRD